MKIKEIRAFPIRQGLFANPIADAPRPPAHSTVAEASNPMSRYPRYKGRHFRWRPTWPHVGCVVTAEDGTWGLGMSRFGGPAATVINEHLAPRLVGEPCMATEKLWDMMVRLVSPYGAAGLAGYAISAVDLALWDLKGKVLQRPVYELLGGPVREKQLCYATGNDVDWLLELGFRAIKIPCPHGPADGIAGLARNEERVAGVRERIGDQVELMLDCWMGLEVEYAVRLAERLRPYDLRWIEECLLPDEWEGWEELRRRVPWQGLATGEHWYTHLPFHRAAAHRVVDVFQPDPMWVGGVTATVKICHLAEAAGIPVMPHTAMNLPYGQHLCIAMPNCPWGEFLLGSPPGVPLADAVAMPGTAIPRDGFLVPNDAPGFGLDVDEAWLENLAA